MNSGFGLGPLTYANSEKCLDLRIEDIGVSVLSEEVQDQNEPRVEGIGETIIKIEEILKDLKKKEDEMKIILDFPQRNEHRKETSSVEISGNETLSDLERRLKEKETEFDQIHEIKTRIDLNFEQNKRICEMAAIINKIIELIKSTEDELFLKAQIVDNKMNKLVGEMGFINNEIKKKKEEEIEKEFQLRKEELNQMKPIPTTKWNNETTLGKLFDGVYLSCFNNVTTENPCSSFYSNIKAELNRSVQTILFDSEWNGFDDKLFCSNCVGQKDVFIILTRQDEKKEIMFIPQLPKVTEEVCCKSVMFPINYHFQNSYYDEIYEIETKICLKECDELLALRPLLFLNKFKSIQFPTGFGHAFFINPPEISKQPPKQMGGIGSSTTSYTRNGGFGQQPFQSMSGIGNFVNSNTLNGLGTGMGNTMGSTTGLENVEVNNLTTNLKWINPIPSLKNYKRIIVLSLN